MSGNSIMDRVDKAIDAAKTLAKQVPTFGVLRLKDLIKAVRNAKTLADERAVIAKESAQIRTSFKEENVELRAINIAKLLYIHMLGYPAHFGQMDCLKLVASPRFADKRLGYLGIMLLLDENQEVLTLVTNSIQNDLRHSNQYIVGLALATLGNISSGEMARDLADEVLKLLESSNPYVRKKAALCALRIVRKVPDLQEEFQDKTLALLSEKNHGVLLTGVTLINEIAQMDGAWLAKNKLNIANAMVRHLKNLVSAGFSPEHDVSGICDPFLQVKILRIMRALGHGDTEISEIMNDVLAQVATNTESSKNVGHAILYEAVLTIMDIESESSLRVLAINILGKFLANKDNNIRYVALNTLCRTCAQPSGSSDSNALQRHRSMVLDCLRDADISIRRRALDLSFFLVNAQNIRLMTKELLRYLEFCESDAKQSVSDRIITASANFRPNKRWEIDTIIRILHVAGSYVSQHAINSFVMMVSTAGPLLQKYTVRKLYDGVLKQKEKSFAQEGLAMSLMWVIGEFGNLLVASGNDFGSLFGSDEAEERSAELAADLQESVSELDVVSLVESCLLRSNASNLVKAYSLTALFKLESRFTNSSALNSSHKLVTRFRSSYVLELQTRSIEYSAMFNFDASVTKSITAPVPSLDFAVREERLKAQKQNGMGSSVSKAKIQSNNISLLGGLNDELLGLNLGTPVSATAGSSAPTTGVTSSKPPVDLLADLFGDTPAAASAKPASQADKISNVMSLFDMGTGTSAVSLTPSPAAAVPTAKKDALLDDLLGPSTTTAVTNGTSPLGSLVVPSGPPLTPGKTSKDPFETLTGLKPSLGIAPVSTPVSIISENASGTPLNSGSALPEQQTAVVAYDKNGLKINFVSAVDFGSSGSSVNVDITYLNTGFANIESVNFQVAVPKTMKLHLHAPTATALAVGSSAHQKMKIENPNKTPLKVRIKISYVINDQTTNEIIDFSKFDSSLWK